MAIATSIRQLIFEDIKETLEAIEADGETYATTIKEVVDTERAPDAFNNYPAVIITPSIESKTQDFNQLYNADMQVTIRCFFKEWSKTTWAAKASEILADMETALMEDYTRGGLAKNTQLLTNNVMLIDVVKPLAGIELTISIQYRHSLRNPRE